MTRRRSNPFAVLLIPFGSLLLAQVEEFPVAVGPPAFGKQPLIQGNLVVWQRYSANRPFTPGMLQWRDLSRGDSQVLDVAPYPAENTGVVLGPTHLFWGNGYLKMLARPIEHLSDGETIPVSDFGEVITASEDYVFFRTTKYVEGAGIQGTFFAKAITALGDPSPEAIRVAAEVQNVPDISRIADASRKYFVWEDRNPKIIRKDSWKIYAKPVDALFTPGAERLVLDSRVENRCGVYLALHDNLLVAQAAAAANREPLGIYLLDIDAGGDPISLATTDDPEFTLSWPALSGEYVVWTKTNFFTRQPYALRLVDGHPQGDPFPISSGGGTWLTIDRNLAVWNGATSFDGGEVFHEAIVAAELPLPGADDVGDVDQDGRITITDAMVILNLLFQGGWKPRLRLADADTNGSLQLSDAVVILRYLFVGGTRPGTRS